MQGIFYNYISAYRAVVFYIGKYLHNPIKYKIPKICADLDRVEVVMLSLMFIYYAH